MVEILKNEIADLRSDINKLNIELRQLKQELNNKNAIIESYELNPHYDFIKILKDADVESIQINL
tara:strand:+ start:952 stop:1146 length:195 start_codon:yes stop_codon:yes gene_type:complete